jgi:FixJ family two-component response regulator
MKIALVIEDDFATRRSIAQLLLADGYGVCEGFQPDPIPFVPALDVIVSDVVTKPELDAVRLWASSIEERFGVPLVIVTGRAEIVAAGPKALGVADIVAKPFDMTDLLRRVRRAVETTQIVPGGLSWN